MFIPKQKPGLLYIYYSSPGKFMYVYTETKLVYVYTETKNQGYYIYIIVTLEKRKRTLRAGVRFYRKKDAANPSFS